MTNLRRPPSVGSGARVGVAALSGAVSAEHLRSGIEALRDLGYEVVTAPNLVRRDRIFAGTDRERLDGFHELVADESIEAIFFARGGHGVLRVVGEIDWDLLAKRPRAYVGYSDLTPFLLGVVQRLGLVAYHGPMVASDLARGLGEAERTSLLDALAGRTGTAMTVRTVRGSGTVRGTLLGGCLSLLASAVGTEFATDFSGSVFFWEDIDEPFYRVDRMLAQLRASGGLSSPRAMLIGDFEPSDGVEGSGGLWPEDCLDGGVLAGVPVAHGCSSGHSVPNLTLPLGAEVELRLDEGRLLLG